MSYDKDQGGAARALSQTAKERMWETCKVNLEGDKVVFGKERMGCGENKIKFLYLYWKFCYI
ncbi:hypothetical protein BBW65_05270 [Helicobacter enhydrae]|uniref:Uncharacterized protein n=1 Tax=Helicobacter enhydrae TaxID=222136 RepID=A0A1B1U688_9HELI|nr:hypothetical protein BBW65_05270 [Helicobacter enhydrae]